MEISRLTAALADRYRIDREIGAGGMATVYLAHDIKHERDVAIKVLHPDLGAALGGERFLTEIRTTARLQHPHILPLLDSGDADGLLYYVMPLVTGESLRARLDRERQLPIPDAVRLAREVASALDYAHRQNVIHRDIKPENILLHDGQAIVADFGIALAVQSAGGARMTQTGLSLGTPSYMSPEQAMGERTIDARSDIYALGAVTYEMLAGDAPFTGGSVQAIVAKVLSERPTSLRTLRDTVPVHVEQAVFTALAKLPADRFATAGEFAVALATPGATTASGIDTVFGQSTMRRTRWRAPLLGVIGVAAGFVAATLLRRAPDTMTTRQQVVLWHHDVDTLTNISHTQAAFAPDGSSIVFADSMDGHWRLYHKNREGESALVIPGTENGISPFFSPDGQWLGFFTSDGALKKVLVAGGAPVTLVAHIDGNHRLGAWFDDGTIMYIAKELIGVRIGLDGQEKRRYQLEPFPMASYPNSPLMPLPGSRGMLFQTCDGNCNFRSVAVAVDLETGKARQILPNARDVHFTSTGHVIATQSGGRVTATPFDVKTLSVTGPSVTVIDGSVDRIYDVSQSGRLLYGVDPSLNQPNQLVWVNRSGKVLSVDSSWKSTLLSPAISPDGRTIAVSTAGESIALWLRTTDGVAQRLRAPGASQWRPIWFNGGKSLAFITRLDENGARLQGTRANSDGSAPSVWLTDTGGVAEMEIAANDSWMVYRGALPDGRNFVFVRRVQGDTTSTRILGDLNQPITFALSPDGRWLAYCADESGTREVFVTSIPTGVTRRQVSHGGGDEPRFSRSGKELFFVSGGNLTVVPVTGSASFEFGAEHSLFPVDGYVRAPNRQQYDVAPGDDRFLMIKGTPHPAVSPVMLVENWFTEFRTKVKR